MNDFVSHVDGRAVLDQGQLDDLYGPVNARAEPAWSGQNDTEGREMRLRSQRLGWRWNG